MPAEPGRAQTIAAIQIARERCGIEQRWHDGLETRACAMRRVLWRFRDSRGASGQFACSLEQLTVAVAPALGWGPIPAADSAERARWFKAHRKSVQRWLDLLTDAGVCHVTGVKDSEGYWWRTVVTLLPHGGLDVDESRLTAARARVRGFKRRERARRHTEARRTVNGGPKRRLRHLSGVLDDSATPTRHTRARLATKRAVACHEHRRRAHVNTQIETARQRRSEHLRVLTHPYGALTTFEPSQTVRDTFLGTSNPPWTVQTLSEVHWVADQTHDRPDTAATRQYAYGETNNRRSLRVQLDPLVVNERSQKVTQERELVPVGVAAVRQTFAAGDVEELGALLRQRVAAREAALDLHRQAVRRRVAEVVSWPAGRPIPRARLREAWIALHPDYGIDTAATTGASAAGNVDAAKLAGTIARYEQFAEHRPPGWPHSGAAALTVLAARGQARALAGDLARLACITRDMTATALHHGDPGQLDRLAERTARARLPRTDTPPTKLSFRRSKAPMESTPEMRRRQRALLLYLGQNPALFPNLGFAEQWLLNAEKAGEIPTGLIPPSAYNKARNTTHVGPDTNAHQTGTPTRVDRYTAENRNGRWNAPAHWHDWLSAASH